MLPLKFLENIVILWFERRFSKQNSAIRLKSNILAPQIFWLATPLVLWFSHIASILADSLSVEQVRHVFASFVVFTLYGLVWLPGVQPGGGAFRAFAPHENFKTLPSNF